MKKLALYEWLIMTAIFSIYLLTTSVENEKSIVTNPDIATENHLIETEEFVEEVCLEKETIIEQPIVKKKVVFSEAPQKKTKKPKIIAFHKGKNRFSFHSNEQVILEGEKNTKIVILPKSFLYEGTDELVDGVIDLELNEFYHKSDFIKANLTTQSNHNNLLETAGAIHIKAFAKGRPCVIRKSNPILVQFPSKSYEEGFQYFKGNYNEKRTMVWKLAKEVQPFEYAMLNRPTAIISSNKKKVQVDIHSKMHSKSQTLNEHNSPFNNWLVKAFSNMLNEENLNDYSMKKVGNQYVFTKAILFEFETSLGHAITTSDFENDEKYKWLLKKSLYNTPREICKSSLQPNETYQNLITVKVALDCTNGCNPEKFKEQYTFSEPINIKDYIALPVDHLGWINCNRFLNDPKPKTDFVVDLGHSNYAEVKLVFQNKNVVVKGEEMKGKYVFKNIPVGEKVIIITTKFTDDHTFYAIEKTQISPSEFSASNFKIYSDRNFNKELQRLNVT